MTRIAAVVGLFLGITACEAPGHSSADSPVVPPAQVADFSQLYAQSCSGCHGTNGRGGPAVELGDPVYLAIANDDAIRRITRDGIAGTAMPAFAEQSGGLLTNAQIDTIVSGIRTRWAKPEVLAQATPPAYTSQTKGDPKQGEATFVTFCASCHGPGGRGGPRASSIADASYLALVSDQHLRTTVIVGVPSLNAPDWRVDVPGHPMSDAEVTDVVAWLASQRPNPAYSTELKAPGGSR